MLSDFSADSVYIRIFGRQSGGNAYRTGTAVDDDDVGGMAGLVTPPAALPLVPTGRTWHTHLVPYLPGPYFYHVTL